MPIPFAQETLDSIIDFAWHDRKLLANWALVHPDCVSSSRHHLFNTVYITLRNRNVWLEILNAPTATAPQHVRRIEVRGGWKISFKEAVVYFVHPKLVKAGKLSLSDLTFDGDMPDSSGLSTFQELVLVDLSAGSYVELFSVISRFRSLTRLDVQEDVGSGVKNHGQPSYDRSHGIPPFPRAFTLAVQIADSLEPFLQWLICSGMAFIDVTTITISDPSPTKLLRLGSNLIKVHLDGELCDQDQLEGIHAGPYSGEFKRVMNLSQHPSLRALHLRIGDSNFHSSTRFLTVLESICPPDPIREGTGLKLLVIAVPWDVCEILEQEAEAENTASSSEDENSDAVPAAKWKKLDELLNTSQFAALEELWFIFDKCSEEALDGYIQGECLPMCGGRGIIFMSEQDCMSVPESWDMI